MKQFIIYDLLNKVYFWEHRGEIGFDLDIEESTKYLTQDKAKEVLILTQEVSDHRRIIEIKEVYFII